MVILIISSLEGSGNEILWKFLKFVIIILRNVFILYNYITFQKKNYSTALQYLHCIFIFRFKAIGSDFAID